MELTREEILQKLKENQSYLSSKYGLKRIGIFGSYANGTQVETSDIDIIVEFDRPIGLKFVEFTEYLEDLLEKKTDVLTTVGVEQIRNSKIVQQIKETIIKCEWEYPCRSRHRDENESEFMFSNKIFI